MASARFAWGIDVGNRALKAVKLVREGDKLRVDDFEVIEHETVLSSSGDNRPQLIQTALANFVTRHQIKGGVAAIGVSGQSSFARFIKLPPVEPKKIPEIVRFEAIQQIPFPLDDVEWAYQLFQEPESPEVEVGIFAMRRELINAHMKFFTDVDLNVQVVQMNPLAVYNAMYYDSRLTGTTMVIDMGAENTDLIIAEGEQVWLRSIPIGGNNFTESLVKAFKLNFAKAEEMKRSASTSKYARQIFQAMRPVFADLVAEVQRSIGFYASTHRDSRIKRIIALGGTFRLPGLQKYLQQNLQLEVDRIDGFTSGAPEDGKLATTFNENLLSMPVAYGLALQAMGQAKINSSLLPQYIRRAKLWKEKTKWFGAAAAMFVVGTGLAYGSLYMADSGKNSSKASAARQTIDTIRSKAERLYQEWATVEQPSPASQQILNVASLMAYRDLWNQILLTLRSSLPSPQAAVASGNPDQIKTVPRVERTQIIIDSITSRYFSDKPGGTVPDLGTILADKDNWMAYAPEPAGATGAPAAPPNYAAAGGGGGGAAGQAAPAAPATPQRGFLITLVCLTPNSAGSLFAEQTLCANLMKLQPGPTLKLPFYIAKAQASVAQRVKDSASRVASLTAAYSAAKTAAAAASNPGAAGGAPAPFMPGTRMPGEDLPRGPLPYSAAGGAAGAASISADENPIVDHLTGEDMRQDWEIKVVIAVVLDPPKTPPPAPGATASAAGSNAP